MADNNAADSYKTCISKYNVNNDADFHKAQALSVIASVTCDITGMQTVGDERVFTDTGTQTAAAGDASDAMERRTVERRTMTGTTFPVRKTTTLLGSRGRRQRALWMGVVVKHPSA